MKDFNRDTEREALNLHKSLDQQYKILNITLTRLTAKISMLRLKANQYGDAYERLYETAREKKLELIKRKSSLRKQIAVIESNALIQKGK